MIDHGEILAIFDVDGTLVNMGDAVDFDALLVETFREYGVVAPSLAERDTLWRAGKDHAILLGSWGVPDARVFWDIFDRLDFEARSSAIDRGRIVLYPDVAPALAKLRASGQVALAVHTNTPAKLARYQLAHFNIATYFDAVLALDIEGYDQSRAKPEAWGIHHLQAKVGAARGKDFTGRTAFIGDSRIDMEAACNAGIPGILVARDAVRGLNKGAFEAVPSLSQITPTRLGAILSRFRTGSYKAAFL
jgi:phosphoglycolate phosphatase-like HAD superfamily hydrolase